MKCWTPGYRLCTVLTSTWLEYRADGGDDCSGRAWFAKSLGDSLEGRQTNNTVVIVEDYVDRQRDERTGMSSALSVM